METAASSTSPNLSIEPITTREEAEWVQEKMNEMYHSKAKKGEIEPALQLTTPEGRPDGFDEVKWPYNAQGYIAINEENNTDQIVGCSVVSVRTIYQLQPQIPSSGVNFDEGVEDYNGYLLFQYITDGFTSQGIGHTLLQQNIDWLRDDTPAKNMFAVNWVRESSATELKGLLSKIGFTHMGTSEYYYNTMQERQTCPECGIGDEDNDYCSCAGSVWKKEF